MDIIMIVFNSLIILLYITLIGFLTPFLLQFMKKRNFDIVMQTLPALILIFLTSTLIAAGLGGFGELLFFRITAFASIILIGFVLFLTFAMKRFWSSQYEQLVNWILSIRREKAFR